MRINAWHPVSACHRAESRGVSGNISMTNISGRYRVFVAIIVAICHKNA
jgi:hypothetical protein